MRHPQNHCEKLPQQRVKLINCPFYKVNACYGDNVPMSRPSVLEYPNLLLRMFEISKNTCIVKHDQTTYLFFTCF